MQCVNRKIVLRDLYQSKLSHGENWKNSFTLMKYARMQHCYDHLKTFCCSNPVVFNHLFLTDEIPLNITAHVPMFLPACRLNLFLFPVFAKHYWFQLHKYFNTESNYFRWPIVGDKLLWCLLFFCWYLDLILKLSMLQSSKLHRCGLFSFLVGGWCG